ncbi:Iron(III) dicitrate transport protein FecA [Raoultella ornithinolytica]|nr:Iron(III) dicitrate transport protein FecA [Raoultella ornithinolytica]
MACTAAMSLEEGLQTLLSGSGLQLKSLGNQAWTLEPAPV